MSGSSCAAIGSVIAYGTPMKPSSTPAKMLGTSSCNHPSAPLPSPAASGQNRSPNRPSGISDDLGPVGRRNPLNELAPLTEPSLVTIESYCKSKGNKSNRRCHHLSPGEQGHRVSLPLS